MRGAQALLDCWKLLSGVYMPGGSARKWEAMSPDTPRGAVSQSAKGGSHNLKLGTCTS